MEDNNTTSAISNATNPPKFEYLPDELKVEILRRLPTKDLSRVMCTAMPWRQLITLSCLPKIAPFTPHHVELVGALLLRLEAEEPRSESTPGRVTVFTEMTGVTFADLIPLLKWCSNVMQCNVTYAVQALLDYCNGLFLFCHRGGNSETLAENFHYYHVANPLTEQCIAILKPNARTDIYSYAALAYHPLESSYFRIVQFRYTGYIKIFSSESGGWVTLKYELPEQVTKAKWERKSVYSRGAVFRISNSGHLLKFLVNPEESLGDQAKAIELPIECKLPGANMCMGVRNNQIMITLSEGDSLRIWGLKECHGGEECTYYWDLQHDIHDGILRRISIRGQLVAIHPHLEIVYFISKLSMSCYCYDAKRVNHRVLKVRSAVFHWVTAFGFPLFECTVPFTCCLRKRYPGIFEWLPIPESCSVALMGPYFHVTISHTLLLQKIKNMKK